MRRWIKAVVSRIVPRHDVVDVAWNRVLRSRSIRLLTAVVLAWVFFVLLNAFFESRSFAHLRAFPAFTSADVVRIERVASGASLLHAEANARRSEFPVYVLPYDADTTLTACDMSALVRMRKTIETELNNRSVLIAPSRHLASAAMVGIGMANRVHPGEFVTDTGGNAAAFDEYTQLLLQALKFRCVGIVGPSVGGVSWLHGLCTHVPLANRPMPTGCSRADLQSYLFTNSEQVRGKNLDDAQMARYRSLLSRVVVGGRNSHLLVEDPRSPDYFPPAGNAMTIVYGDPAKPKYLCAIEVQRRDHPFHGLSNPGGSSLEARYVLFDTTAKRLYQSSRNRVTTVLTRKGVWWLGLRPSAVLVSEQQLASRFFDEMKTLKDGLKIPDQIAPSPTEQGILVEYITQVLRERLGRHAVPAGTSAFHGQGVVADEVLDVHPTSMESWIEWPRRFNGGTWWGVIQFAIVAIFIAFLLEATYLADEILLSELVAAHYETWQSAKMPVAVTPQEAFAAEMAGILEDRMWFLNYLNTALPLLGFFGTVVGLSISLVGASGVSAQLPADRQAALQSMTVALGTAFDKSFFAFLFSIFTNLGCYRIACGQRQYLRSFLEKVGALGRTQP